MNGVRSAGIELTCEPLAALPEDTTRADGDLRLDDVVTGAELVGSGSTAEPRAAVVSDNSSLPSAATAAAASRTSRETADPPQPDSRQCYDPARARAGG